jgi:hypothetical protein
MMTENTNGVKATDADVERCAEAFAAVRQFPKADRPAVLARYGLDEERFSALLGAIARAMAGGLPNEDPRLLLRFAGAYGAADRFIRQERPRAKDLRPMLTDVAPLQAAPAPSGGAPAPAPDRVPAHPSNLRFVRYDPQTGKLLHTPRWEEDA